MSKEAQRALEAPLPPEVEAYLVEYVPRKLPADSWEAVRPMVLDLVRKAGPPSCQQAKRLVFPAAMVAVFASARGIELRPEIVFTDAVIEEWARLAAADGVPANSIATYRAHLRALLRGPRQEAELSRKRVSAPYTATEDLALRRMSVGQRTPIYRANACFLYGLPRGAGLSSQDLKDLQYEAVVDHGADGIEVAIGDRVVWVLEEFEDVVRTGLHVRGPGEYLVGDTGKKRHISGYVDRFAAPRDTPRLEVTRARSTWFVDHLNRGTPLPVLTAAVGTRNMRRFEDLLEYCDDISTETAQRRLRGTG